MGEKVEDAIEKLLDVVADNVRHLMVSDRRLAGKNRPKELAEAAGLGKGTVQRILRGSAKDEKDPAPNAAKIDTLMRIAWYFDQPLPLLLVPRDKMSRMFDSHDAIPTAMEGISRDLKRIRR